MDWEVLEIVTAGDLSLLETATRQSTAPSGHMGSHKESRKAAFPLYCLLGIDGVKARLGGVSCMCEALVHPSMAPNE